MRQANIRFATFVVVALGLGGFIYWLKNRPPDMPLVDIPPVDSRGMVAALMETPSGERLVAIAPDGEIREAKTDGEAEDSDIEWTPDGRRVIFVSNRTTDGSFQLFHWLPDRDNDPFQLTENGASRDSPWFAPGGGHMLYVSRGNVAAISYPQRRTWRVMPPSDQPDTHQTGEGEHVHTAEHRHNEVTEAWNRVVQSLEGEAFRKGYVDRSGKHFVGVFTNPRGQVLILQNLDPQQPEDAVARAPVGGQTVEVAMSRRKPLAVVTVVDFVWPDINLIPEQYVKPDGTVSRDFANAMFLVDFETTSLVPVFVSPNDDQAAYSATLSPDGTKIALVFRQREAGVDTRGLLVIPAKEGGIREGTAVAQGDLSDPAWSPDGSRIAFVRGGDIWVVNADGSGEKNLTTGRGRFRTPRFSPMG